jgi:uncharacterized oxidoreductase
MPLLHAPEIRAFTSECFAQAGFPKAEADLIARLLVEANLTGHETHGIRQIPRYLKAAHTGEVKAGAPVTVLQETPATALLDAHYTLGFVGATQAVELAIAKARETKVAAVAVRNLNHVGRVGAYPEMAAAQGFVCLAYTNAQGAGKSVAPFGGLGRLVGTNPMAAAFPGTGGFPILLDFATSATAANKIRVAHTRGKPTGPGWIVDDRGTPTTDPKVFMDGKGSQVPLGGEQGHKGFGLAVMVDILGGILAGAGAAPAPTTVLNNGTFLICIDPDAFVAKDQYARQLTELIDYLHAAPPAPGKPGVILPGEYEHRNRLRHTEHGFEVEEEIWRAIVEAARAVHVQAPAPVPVPVPSARA